MLECQDRTLEASRNASTTVETSVEMGEDFHRFYGMIPLTRLNHDSYGMIVYRLTKLFHFLLVKATYTSSKLTKIFISEIVKLQRV